MAIFKKPFPPGRPAGPSDYQDLVEIHISPKDTFTPRPVSPVSINSTSSTLLNLPSPTSDHQPPSPTQGSTNITIFYLSKTLLNRYSDLFQSIFKNPSTANKEIFFFQDIDVDIFAVLANWLPNATIVDCSGERSGQKLDMKSLARLSELAERLEIRSLRNNIVKEAWKVLECAKEDGKGKAEMYIQLLECPVEELRGLALEHLIMSVDFLGVMSEMEKGLEEGEKEELRNMVEGKRNHIEMRRDIDLEDKELGDKTKRPWHKKPWFKIYFV